MSFYKINIIDGYSYFGCDSIESLDKLQNRNYSNIKDINFKTNVGDVNKFGDISIIDFSTLLVFSSKAKKVFSSFGNFIKLPKLCEYELFEPKIVDALDYDKSSIDYFKESKNIKRIRKYILKQNMVSDVNAFVLPIFPSSVFVNDEFINMYKENNFEGLEFSKISD